MEYMSAAHTLTSAAEIMADTGAESDSYDTEYKSQPALNTDVRSSSDTKSKKELVLSDHGVAGETNVPEIVESRLTEWTSTIISYCESRPVCFWRQVTGELFDLGKWPQIRHNQGGGAGAGQRGSIWWCTYNPPG